MLSRLRVSRVKGGLSVNLSPVSYPQHDKVFRLDIKDDAVIADPEPVSSQIGVYQRLGMP